MRSILFSLSFYWWREQLPITLFLQAKQNYCKLGYNKYYNSNFESLQSLCISQRGQMASYSVCRHRIAFTFILAIGFSCTFTSEIMLNESSTFNSKWYFVWFQSCWFPMHASQIMWQGSGPWLICALKWAEKALSLLENSEAFFKSYHQEAPASLIMKVEWNGEVPAPPHMLKLGNVFSSEWITTEAIPRKTGALGINFRTSWQIYIWRFLCEAYL